MSSGPSGGASAQGARTPFARGSGRGRSGGDGGPMVPDARPESYYGRPIIKEPKWTWEVPWYLWAGGMAGAAAPLSAGARLAGNAELARAAALVGFGGAAISPVLLILDLGRPRYFLHMLRVFKTSSPMSVGTWVLSTFAPLVTVSAAAQALPDAVVPASVGGVPVRALLRGAGGPAAAGAAVLGPVLSTYTAVLIANTAVPVWHDARRALPFVFAASSLASSGGMCVALTSSGRAGPARRVAVAGGALELVATTVMTRGLDPRVANAYATRPAQQLERAAKAATVVGVATVGLLARRSRAAAVGGGLALAAGAALERWAVFKAGFASARDPAATVGPQRDRRAADGARRPVSHRDGEAPTALDPATPEATRPGPGPGHPTAPGPGQPEVGPFEIAPRRAG